jgi:hypothetical protein
MVKYAVILMVLITNIALAQTTTILSPDGSVTICQVGSNGIVICV